MVEIGNTLNKKIVFIAFISFFVLIGCGGQPEDDLDPEAVIPPTLQGINVTAAEGSNLNFALTLEYKFVKDITADYELQSGTATEGIDFASASGSIIIKAGTGSVALSLPTTQDNLDENNESLSLVITNITNATGTTLEVPASIVDDDATPTLSIFDTFSSEGGTLSFEVSLSAVSGRNVTFNYTTIDSSASNPFDFTAQTGLGNILAGRQSIYSARDRYRQ